MRHFAGAAVAALLVLPAVLLFVPETKAEIATSIPSIGARDRTSSIWDGSNFYIFGGGTATSLQTDQILRHDPITHAVTAVATLPTARACTSAIWDGANAYIFGGEGAGYLSDIVRYTPSTNAIAVVASLPSARSCTSAIWDGSNAYIFGGKTSAGGLKEVIRFNPTTKAVINVFPITGGLPTERKETAAIWDGTHAYIFGGYSGSAGALSEVVRFNPVTSIVTSMAAMPTPLRGMAAVQAGGGQAYIFGGWDPYTTIQDKILRYDIAAGSFTTMSTTLPSPRYLLTAAWSGQAAYIFGGATNYGLTMGDTVRYTPTLNSISVVGNVLPRAIYDFGMASDGQSAYIFGGYSGGFSNAILRFNLATSALSPVAVLPSARSGSSAVWDGTNVYVFGGKDESGSYLNHVVKYNPATNTVTTVASLPSGRAYTSAIWSGSNAYIFGGQTSSSSGINQIIKYNPASNTVTTLAATLPGAYAYTTAVFDSGRHTAYIFGGSATTDFVRFYTGGEYTAPWGNANLPERMAAVWDGMRVYLFGGEDASGSLAAVRSYDPATNAFQVLGTGLPVGTAQAGAVWHARHAVLFGGKVAPYTGGAAITTYAPEKTYPKVISNLPTARGRTSAVWDGSNAYIFAGEDGMPGLRNEIVRFNPATNTVTTMPGGFPYYTAGTAAIWDGSSAYIFGGVNNPSGVHKYVPSTNTLTALPSLPDARIDATAVWSGTYAYIFGGTNAAGVKQTAVLRYDPAANTAVTLGAVTPSGKGVSGAVWDGTHLYVFVPSTGTTGQVLRYSAATDSFTVVVSSYAFDYLYHPRMPAIWDGQDAYLLGKYVVRFTPATNAISTIAKTGNFTWPHDTEYGSAIWTGQGIYAFGGVYQKGIIEYNGLSAPVTPTAQPTAMPGQIQVSWSPPVSGGAPVTGYRIYTTASNPPLAQVAANVLSFTDGNLAGGASKTYRVTAMNAIGEGPSSILVTGTALPFPPSAPYIVWVQNGVGQLTLTWTAAYDGGGTITAHKVYRGTTPSNLQLVTSGGCTNLGNVVTCTDSGLGNGQTRYYRISAVNAAGEGEQSSCCASGTTASVPSAPLALTSSAGPGAGQISLAWQAPANTGGISYTYKVYGGSTSSNLALITTGGCANLSSTNLACVDGNLGNGATRYYYVKASNLVGESPSSNQVSATTFTPPSAPLNLGASAGPGGGQITLTWQAPANTGGAQITGYKVYRGTTSNGEVEVTSGPCSGLGNVLTCTDSGLGNGQTRYYKVAAINVAGPGPQSNEASATTFMPPSPPQNLQAASDFVAQKVHLTWLVPTSTGGTALTGYTVYRGLTSNAPTTQWNVGNVLAWDDTSCPVGSTCYYTVVAVNVAGPSTASNQASALGTKV